MTTWVALDKSDFDDRLKSKTKNNNPKEQVMVQPISFSLVALEQSPRFVEGYDLPEGVSFIDPQDSTVLDVDAVQLCRDCLDSSWLRPADFALTLTYRWEGETSITTGETRKVCREHIVAEAENFRDMGR